MGLRFRAGRFSPPARPSPRSAAPVVRKHSALKPALAIILHVAVSDRCSSVRNVYTLREFTSRLTATPFLSSPFVPFSTSGCQHLAMPALDREPRGIPPSSGPLPGSRFQQTVPGAPVGLGSSVSLVNPAREGVIPCAWGGVSTSKKVFRPAFRLRPFGFRRCRGGPKQEPCQRRSTGERRVFERSVGKTDPTTCARACLWRTIHAST